MKIPFGKFKGTFLCDLPDDYLAWLQTIELRDPLRAAIFAEAKERAREKTCQELFYFSYFDFFPSPLKIHIFSIG